MHSWRLVAKQFFYLFVIYTYVLAKICVIIGNNKKFPKNNKINLYVAEKI